MTPGTIAWVILIMLGMGVFGGCANYLIAPKVKEPVPGEITPSWITSIVMGVAAAGLVPLFLTMISSNLLDFTPANAARNLFTFSGFCLLAAIFSTTFVQSLSERVLREIQKTAAEVRSDKKEVEKNVRQVEAVAESIDAAVSEPTAPEEARPLGTRQEEQHVMAMCSLLL